MSKNSIKIKNFQSIKDVEFDFGGLTVLYGESNMGKSSIVRAFKVLFYGLSSAATYVRSGEESFSISLSNDFLKESFLNYSKSVGPKINSYTIGNNIYTKIGRGVPEELSDMGFKRVDGRLIGVNVQDQFDSIFLLGDSGIVAAKYFSDITKISQLKEAMALCSEDLKQQKKEFQISEKSLQEINSKLLRYEDLPLVEDSFVKTKKDFEEYKVIEKISTMTKEYKVIRTGKEGADRLILELEDVLEHEKGVVEMLQNLLDILKLVSLFQEVENVIAPLQLRYTQLVDKVPKLEDFLMKTDSLVKEVSNFLTLQTDYKKMQHLYCSSDKEIESICVEVGKSEEQITSLRSKFGVCPLCGSIKNGGD